MEMHPRVTAKLSCRRQLSARESHNKLYYTNHIGGQLDKNIDTSPSSYQYSSPSKMLGFFVVVVVFWGSLKHGSTLDTADTITG